jgi:hypothetical protein
MWTEFQDMHSGGGQKLEWPRIYIEAPEAEAKIIFQNRFGRNPDRVTCTCCGPDYWTDESETLEQATAFVRGCAFNKATGKYEERIVGADEIRLFVKEYTPFETWLKDWPTKTTRGVCAPWPVHVVHAADIRPEERVGELRPEGYVWAGD